MSSNRFLILWLYLGLAWFFLAMGASATNKLYQQGLIIFFWVPALAAIFVFRRELIEVIRARWLAFLLMALLVAWVLFSLTWSDVENPAQRAKRILYIILFCAGMAMMALKDEKQFVRLLLCLACAMAALAAWHIYQFYIASGMSWGARLRPGAQIDHPILGGYVMGVCAVIAIAAIANIPGRMLLAIAVAIPVLLVFMLLTQSRGVLLALIATVVLLPLSRPSRTTYTIAACLVLASLVGFFMLEPFVTSRGLSYRPEIFAESFRMILDSPFTGVGASGSYAVTSPEYPDMSFVHSHNLFLHVGIELGVPGLALFSMIWLWVGLDGWRYRLSGLGGTLFAVWVYSTVAVMFDVASLWNPPRSEWTVTWFPIGLWMALMVARGRQQVDQLAMSASARSYA